MYGNFVEKFEEKKSAFDEGRIRIDKCQKILDSHKYGTMGGAKIFIVGGSIDEPVSSIKIEGTIEVKDLPIIYKLLTGKKS